MRLLYNIQLPITCPCSIINKKHDDSSLYESRVEGSSFRKPGRVGALAFGARGSIFQHLDFKIQDKNHDFFIFKHDFKNNQYKLEMCYRNIFRMQLFVSSFMSISTIHISKLYLMFLSPAQIQF